MVAKAVHGLFYLFEIRTFFELWHCGTRSLATDGREFYQTGLTDRRPVWVVESGGPKKPRVGRSGHWRHVADTSTTE